MRATLFRGLGGTAAVVAAAAMAPIGHAQRDGRALNGFDLSGAIIPINEILSGGPPRDGIPAVDRPSFVPPTRPSYLLDDDLVVSVTVEGKTRAYPLRILARHEIVNDRIGGEAFAVTYCPLCGTAMVFNRVVGGRLRSFAVSGLLYQSDVLMYDRQSDCLWSQLAMKAVSGPLAGTRLEWIPSGEMGWAAWRKAHPRGEVLTDGGARNLGSLGDPYAAYARSPNTMFPVAMHRNELPKKSWVLGIVAGGQAKAYPLAQLAKSGVVGDTVRGLTIEVSYDPLTRGAAVVEGRERAVVPSVRVYWFAWQAFHPDTLVWEP